MSRVGKNPVAIPEGVEVQLSATNLTAKGKLGTLSCMLSDKVKVSNEDNKIVIIPVEDDMEDKAHIMWGTVRANIANTIQGVSEGFSKTLEVNGIGYRANVQGKNVVLTVGKSHDDVMEIPEGLSVKTEKPNLIIVSGADKQAVGAFAAEIRAKRPPEPYKGKGIKYADEHIVRKEGKKK